MVRYFPSRLYHFHIFVPNTLNFFRFRSDLMCVFVHSFRSLHNGTKNVGEKSFFAANNSRQTVCETDRRKYCGASISWRNVFFDYNIVGVDLHLPVCGLLLRLRSSSFLCSTHPPANQVCCSYAH